MEWLNSFLTVIGAFSILIGIVRFCWLFVSSGSEWLNHVKIKTEQWDNERDYGEFYTETGECIYPIVYNDTPDCGEEINVTFFVPENSVIRNIRIKKVIEESIPSGKERYKTVVRYPQITPDRPLCMIVERREAIPKYVVEWRTLYGGKAVYYFYSNLRNDAYDKSGIQYTYNAISRIRKFFDLM